MRFIGNFLWCFFGGGLIALLWILSGMLCCCTIIGIPMGLQCFKFAQFIMWPFGRQIIFANRIDSLILNMIWIFMLGWELALLSLIVGLVWCITIVGVPFGLQCFKFAQLALMPFGATIVHE